MIKGPVLKMNQIFKFKFKNKQSKPQILRTEHFGINNEFNFAIDFDITECEEELKVIWKFV